MHSKAAPKYGSEKSGAPTNYYITLSPEPVQDHQRRAGRRRNRHLAGPQGVQPHQPAARAGRGRHLHAADRLCTPLEVWRELPQQARKTIRDKKIHFFVIDAFAVAKRHAPTPDLETRMMGIAFIGAVVRPCRPRVGRRLPDVHPGENPPADQPRSSAPRAARSSTATWP